MNPDIESIRDQLYKLAEMVRGYNENHADMLRWLAKTMGKHPNIAAVVNTFGPLLTEDHQCPYCGDDPNKAGKIKISKLLCNTGRDYAAGYRAEWKCETCGEMEIR